jgi:hypothetical protein
MSGPRWLLPALAAVSLAVGQSPADGAEPSLPEHATPIADYTLRASLDPAAHAVHGVGTITWRNGSSLTVHELWVHLYLNAFKDEKSVWQRESVLDGRGSPVTGDGRIDVRKFALHGPDGSAVDLWAGAELHRADDEDETDARVPLPRGVAPGEAITIDVEWDDRLPSSVQRAGYVSRLHMVTQWFPKVARLEPDGRWAHFPLHHLAEFYADYGTYDVTLDVPEDFVVGATGPVVEAHAVGGRRLERHVQSDVHDFAWTAWDQWRTATEAIDGVRVAILYPPGFDMDAHRELDAVRFALPWLSAHYGRYPYDVLTVVHCPPKAGGGMEYPTLVTTAGPWYGPPGVFLLEDTTVHELAHQWFYGLVGTNEVDWPFLDEGLTSFAGASVMDAWRRPGDVIDLLGLEIGGEETSGFIDGRQHDAPIAQPAYAFATGDDYSALVYQRASTLLLTLARVYGEERVQGALGRYAREYRFRHPVPEDLLAVLADALGERVRGTLRTALFDEGWVDYLVEVTSAPADAAGSSVLVQRRGTLSFPVDVELIRTDGSRERRRWDGEGRAFRIPYGEDVPLRAAVVDPDHAVLLDEDPSNNSALAPGEPSAGAPRVLERVLYWAELVAQAIVP